VRRSAVVPALAAGIVLAGLNLRIAVASVPPVLDELQRDLAISPAAAGLLTSIPVLCFGLLAPAVPGLTRRYGAERVLLAALIPIIAGTLLRGVPSTIVPFAATAAAGAGIAVANVLVPAVVKARFVASTGSIMGLYVGSLGVGAAAAAGLTSPMAAAFGDRWNVALAFWALPALLAAVVVGVAVRRAGEATGAAGVGNARALLRDGLAWQVTLFMGLQSLIFYAGLAWLPSLLRDSGYAAGEAGAALSLYALLGIPASLVVPSIAVRLRGQRALAALTALIEVVALAGLLWAPDRTALVWVALFGIGQGAAFSLALTLIVLRSPSAARAAELSAMAQTIGYSLAALGPVGLGVIHDAAGGWEIPLGVLLVCAVSLVAAGIAAGRSATVASS
jgi:MFS transporter, CP family, cyanate transporter